MQFRSCVLSSLWLSLILSCFGFIEPGGRSHRTHRPKCMHHNVTGNGKVAIAFFGLSRGLSYTLPSIERHVFNILHKHNIQFDVFWYTVVSHSINRTRDSITEHGELNPYDVRLVSPCRFTLMDQEMIREREFRKFLRARNMTEQDVQHDVWHDDFGSVRNILCSYFTLAGVGLMVEEYQRNHQIKYDVILAIRPDTAMMKDVDILENLEKIKSGAPVIFVPDFQPWGGYNDRAAFGSPKVMKAYFNRGAKFRDTAFFENGETLLLETLRENNIIALMSKMRVLRVRVDGKVHTTDAAYHAMNVRQDDADFHRCVEAEERILRKDVC